MFVPIWVIVLVVLFVWPDLVVLVLGVAALWLLIKALFWLGLLGVVAAQESLSFTEDLLPWIVAAWMIAGLVAARPWELGKDALELGGIRGVLLFPTIVAAFPTALFATVFGFLGLPILIGSFAYTAVTAPANLSVSAWRSQPASESLLFLAVLVGSSLVWTWLGIRGSQRLGHLPLSGRADTVARNLERLAMIGVFTFMPCYLLGELLLGW
jgi:hypothetical protein